MLPAFAQQEEKLTFAIVYPNIHPFFDAIGEGAEQIIAEQGYMWN